MRPTAGEHRQREGGGHADGRQQEGDVDPVLGHEAQGQVEAALGRHDLEPVGVTVDELGTAVLDVLLDDVPAGVVALSEHEPERLTGRGAGDADLDGGVVAAGDGDPRCPLVRVEERPGAGTRCPAAR